MSEIKYGITHSGNFHADDIFCTALLKILYSDIKIFRVEKLQINNKTIYISETKEIIRKDECIIYDIGNKTYDHHIRPFEKRKNGVLYSSFGKLWRDFGSILLPNNRSWSYIDHALVQEIDKADNGMGINPLSLAIKQFNICWNENDKEINNQFDIAVNFAKQILENFIKRKLSEEEANKVFEEACKYQTGHIVVLPQFVPIPPGIRENIDFVIYPSNREGYNVSVIKDYGSDTFNENAVRKFFPLDWEEKLPEGLNYMNNKIANFDTLENAVIAANDIYKLDVNDNVKELVKILDDNDWICTDYNGNKISFIHAYEMGDGSICPVIKHASVFSLMPLEVTRNNKLTLSFSKTYGTMINYPNIWDGLQKGIDQYNKTTTVKIVELISKI